MVHLNILLENKLSIFLKFMVKIVNTHILRPGGDLKKIKEENVLN